MRDVWAVIAAMLLAGCQAGVTGQTPAPQEGGRPSFRSYRTVKRTICLTQAGDYQGVTDTTLKEEAPSASYYYRDTLQADGRTAGSLALLRFDEIPIPPDAEITRAFITLTMESRASGDRGGVGAYRMLSDCDFERATWAYANVANLLKWGGDSQSVPLAGVDYEASEPGWADCSEIMPGDTVRIDVTPAVKFWNERPDENFGLLLRPDEGKSAGQFHSSKSPETSRRPRLYVTYTMRVQSGRAINSESQRRASDSRESPNR